MILAFSSTVPSSSVAARKPIELPNDQHIPFTELFQGLVKLRPIPSPTGGNRRPSPRRFACNRRGAGLLLGRQCLGRRPWRRGHSRQTAHPFSSRLRFVTGHHPKSLVTRKARNPVVIWARSSGINPCCDILLPFKRKRQQSFAAS